MKMTLSASMAGLLDTAGFALTRRDLLRSKPTRAAGTLASLALWGALAQSAASGQRSRARKLAALGLAANSAMLAGHLRARVANPRIFAGAGLAAAALAGTFGGE